MVTTASRWALLPTAQWAQLKIGRWVVPGWGLKSAMIGLVTARRRVTSPTTGCAPPRAIGSKPLFWMATKRRPMREKITVELINSLKKTVSRSQILCLCLKPPTYGPGTTDPCPQWVFQPRFAWNIWQRASLFLQILATPPPWKDHAVASGCQTWPPVCPPKNKSRFEVISLAKVESWKWCPHTLVRRILSAAGKRPEGWW